MHYEQSREKSVVTLAYDNPNDHSRLGQGDWRGRDDDPRLGAPRPVTVDPTISQNVAVNRSDVNEFLLRHRGNGEALVSVEGN
jgi:hypothetical protein